MDGVYFDVKMNDVDRIEKNNVLIKAAEQAKAIIYQSTFSKKIVESILGISPEYYEIINNGTDLNIFNPIGNNKREMLNIPDDNFVFITSAKWRSHKRLNDIINIYSIVKKNTKLNTNLLIIGDTNQYCNDDSVIFLRNIPNIEIPSYLRSANCYLFLSWLDPCPNSVIEAIACNIPVICSNQGGTHEIINLTCGGIVVDADEDYDFKLCDLYNPPVVRLDVLVEAVLKLINNYDFYKANINSAAIDINQVAKKYYNFIEKINSIDHTNN